MQVNVRLEESDWERIVEAMPGLSNAERMSRLVRQQLTLLESRRDLARALQLVESALDPVRQSLRRERLLGRGSDVAEELAECVIESAAMLLAHTEQLQRTPERHLAEMEAGLVRRWARATLQILRTAALDPARIRHQNQSLPEIQRVLSEARTLPHPSTNFVSPSTAATPNQG